MPNFIIIDESNSYLIEEFLTCAGNALHTFRYFEKRSLSILKNHLVTMIATRSGKPVCYAHLDRENGKTWLGIAVIEAELGRGWGNRMMNELISRARAAQEKKIFLSVDNENIRARRFYERYAFKASEVHDKYTIYELDLSLDIAISTIAFMGEPLNNVIDLAAKENFKIEFSSGVPYFPKVKEVFLHAPIQKILHNYFPPPAVPFVLNLASTCNEIRLRSVQHCIQGLQLSAEIAAPFFSAHAGFCVDPDC